MAKIEVSNKLKSGGRLATVPGCGADGATLGAAIDAQVTQAHGNNHFFGHIVLVKPQSEGSRADFVNQGSCVPLGGD